MTHFSWCTPHITQRHTQSLDRLFIHCCVRSPSASGDRTIFLLTLIPVHEDSPVTNTSQWLHAEGIYSINYELTTHDKNSLPFLKLQMHFFGGPKAEGLVESLTETQKLSHYAKAFTDPQSNPINVSKVEGQSHTAPFPLVYFFAYRKMCSF